MCLFGCPSPVSFRLCLRGRDSSDKTGFSSRCAIVVHRTGCTTMILICASASSHFLLSRTGLILVDTGARERWIARLTKLVHRTAYFGARPTVTRGSWTLSLACRAPTMVRSTTFTHRGPSVSHHMRTVNLQGWHAGTNIVKLDILSTVPWAWDFLASIPRPEQTFAGRQREDQYMYICQNVGAFLRHVVSS